MGARNRPIDKNSRKIKILERVLIGKVVQLFRNSRLPLAWQDQRSALGFTRA
jgi:hypothetical protein